jgi:molecular chaperone DnaJ
MAADYYAVLGVGADASEDAIKKAYRKRARELHPDANPDDPASEEQFKELTLAYETLRDPERRRRYDMFGPEGGGAAGGPGGFNDVFGMGDIFDAFFGGSTFGAGGRRRSGGGPTRQPGPDASVEVEIPFETAAFGGEIEVEVEILQGCEACSGSGAAPGTTPVRCGRCSGRGEVQEMRRSILGSLVVSQVCPQCRGTGEEIPTKCPECRGEGRRAEYRTLKPTVPAGVDDGTQLRLQGRGHAGPRGGPPGDLYVFIHVAAHPDLERVGNDLVATARVGLAQAALGCTVAVPTLDGEQELAIPPGTQPGRVFTLRRGGIPYLNASGRGDLKVVVEVEVPTSLGSEEEKALRRYAEAKGEEVASHKGFFEKIKSVFS